MTTSPPLVTVRTPVVGAVGALALVTVALEMAAVALDPRDVAGTLVLAAGIWFQGVWGVMAWLRPRRDIVVAGLVANVVMLAICVLRLTSLTGRAPLTPELLVVVFQGVLVAGLAAALFGRRSTLLAARRASFLPAGVGAVALVLAWTSLVTAGPSLPPPGVDSPIVGAPVHEQGVRSATPDAVVAATSPVDGVIGAPGANSSPGASPGVATPQLAPASAGAQASAADTTPPAVTPAAVSIPTATPSVATATPVPSSNAVAPTARAAATPTARPAAPPAATPPATTTRPTSDPSTARPTATRTAATAPATPAPATGPPAPAPLPTPSPTRAPTVAPTPSPTPRPTPPPAPSATTAPGIPGTITFGRDYDHDTLAILGRTSTIHAHDLVAWRADLSQPAGSTTLTFTITQPNPNGPEFPHWQQDFGVPDASYEVIVNRVDLSVYVHGEPGTFIMRIRRGPEGPILAEGRFSLIP